MPLIINSREHCSALASKKKKRLALYSTQPPPAAAPERGNPKQKQRFIHSLKLKEAQTGSNEEEYAREFTDSK